MHNIKYRIISYKNDTHKYSATGKYIKESTSEVCFEKEIGIKKQIMETCDIHNEGREGLVNGYSS